jgi:cytochrome c biogenesis protein CcmG/thiol:disulfide interchange protein DsbE
VTVGAAARALLACALLVIAHAPGAGAQPAVTSLLTPLNLVAYSARVAPPDFAGATADDRQISMAALRGQVVLVNFWATWCVECRPEMAVFERLHRELSPRGFVVLGVNAREETEAVRRYARALDLTFPLVLDASGKINTLYGVIGIPTSFLVGRDGRAVAFGVGPREWGSAAARALIEALLAEPAPRPVAP